MTFIMKGVCCAAPLGAVAGDETIIGSKKILPILIAAIKKERVSPLLF
ncbi:hypothetical protein [Chryseobacterium sp. MEBOG07]|nr:hypothetical protein [Chryseobacterium sp. MEBOG07]UKB78557.1 hypothetical protein LF886_19115 [Chryseobacterium sp. MEBOG07]